MAQGMLERLKSLIPGLGGKRPAVVPVVRLSGAIGVGLGTRGGLTAQAVEQALETAFTLKRAPAVALVISSPGGSPVQSHLIFAHVRRLAEKHERPVLAFVEDVAASGGYMLACAGDEIFADPSSIVGSIGVVSQGFGFTGLIERIGVERRVYTAGRNKAILDPFRPEREEEVAHLKDLQQDVHAMFIDLVKDRRGAKLAEHDELFTGLFWSGAKARDLGLIDGLATMRSVLAERYGDDVKLRQVPIQRASRLRKLLFGAGGAPAAETAEALVDAAVDRLEERLTAARYGR